jgi:hypothetical protein
LQNRPLGQYCTREHTTRDTVVCMCVRERETEICTSWFSPGGQ